MNPNNLPRLIAAIAVALTLSMSAPARAAEPATKPLGADKLKLSQEQLDNMYLQSVMLLKYGRYEEAEALARRLQVEAPDNRDIKQLLADIARARGHTADKRPNELQRKLAELTIPEINVREAVAQDVVTFL